MITITINGESWAEMGHRWAEIKINLNMLKMNQNKRISIDGIDNHR